MYLRKLIIENVGPIERVDFDLPFNVEGNPKPAVLIGTNGSGKSIALSFIANTLLAMQQAVFENAEVQAGRVYKLRSPGYIRAGANYYRFQAEFDEAIRLTEWQIHSTRGEFEKSLDEAGMARQRALPGWSQIPLTETSVFDNTFMEQTEALQKIWAQQVMLYFPADRHESPAWLNEDDLKYRPSYALEPKIHRRTDRRVVRTVALKGIMDWILDVALDTRMSPNTVPVPNQPYPLLLGYNNTLETDVVSLLLTILQVPKTGNPLLNVGNRRRRLVGRSFYDQSGKLLASNTLLSLSSGEAQLFTLFASILMDYDKTDVPYTSMADVRGIVLVDEADLHLHIELQRNGRVEVWRGGVGRAYPLAAPFGWRCLTGPTVLRLQTPLIEPDGRISRIRLSEKASRFRPQEVATGARLKTRQAQHGVQVRVREASRPRFRRPVLRTQPLA